MPSSLSLTSLKDRLRALKPFDFLPSALKEGKDIYGVDIGSTSIKIMQLNRKTQSDPWKLECWAYQSLSGGDQGTETEKTEEVVGFIKDFLAIQKKGPHSAALSVSGNSVVVRYVKLPKMPKEQLAKTLALEAEPYIPFPLSEVNIGFQILREVSEEEQQKMETVLVAVKKERINQSLEIIKTCNLQPAIVDIDAFCLQHLVCPEATQAPTPPEGQTVMILNMGAALTTASIVEEGVCRVVRDIFIAGHAINKTLQKKLGLSPQESEAAKRNARILLNGEEAPSATEMEKGDLLEISRVVTGIVKDLALEIQRSLDFYLSQQAERQVQKVLLTGGCAKIHGIVSYLSSELRLPVELLDPLQNIAGSDAVPQEIRPHLAIVTGLAMRRTGDSA